MKKVTLTWDTYMGLISSSGEMQGALLAVAPQLFPQQQKGVANIIEQAKTTSARAIAEANTTHVDENKSPSDATK